MESILVKEEVVEEVNKEEKSFEPLAALLGRFETEGEKNSLYWLSLLIDHARIGLVSDNENHPFITKLKAYQQSQQFVTVHFKEDYVALEETTDDYVNLIEFEKVPTAKEVKHLEKQRRRWVQLYLKFLSYRYNIPRAELLPRISYNQEAEGPFNPYYTAVSELDNTNPQKQLLMKHFDKLNYVHWIRSEKDGFVFNLTGSDPDDLLEQLIIGCWSIFAAFSLRETIFPTFYIMEISEKIIPNIQLGLRAEIIEEMVNLMTDLTFAPLDEYYGTTNQLHPLACMLIRSTQLFPLPQARLKHLFHEKLKSIDYDLSPIIQEIEEFKENEVLWESYENDKHILTKIKFNVE